MNLPRAAIAAVVVASSGSLEVRADEDHEFIAPTSNSVRSPCPGMNVLANHGYIHRDGKAVDLFGELAQGLEDMFGLAADAHSTAFLQRMLVGGLAVTQKGNRTLVNLDAFSNHVRDASLVKHDAYVEDPQKLFSKTVFQSWIDSCEGESCTMGDVVDAMVARMEETCADNPNPFANPRVLSSFAISKAADVFFYTTLQADPTEDYSLGSTINATELRVFVEENRLPDGFTTRAEAGLPTWSPFAEPAFPEVMARVCTAILTLKAGGCDAIPTGQCEPPPPPAAEGAAAKDGEDDSAVKENSTVVDNAEGEGGGSNEAIVDDTEGGGDDDSAASVAVRGGGLAILAIAALLLGY